MLAQLADILRAREGVAEDEAGMGAAVLLDDNCSVGIPPMLHACWVDCR